jgi:hypothetical protein
LSVIVGRYVMVSDWKWRSLGEEAHDWDSEVKALE